MKNNNLNSMVQDLIITAVDNCTSLYLNSLDNYKLSEDGLLINVNDVGYDYEIMSKQGLITGRYPFSAEVLKTILDNRPYNMNIKHSKTIKYKGTEYVLGYNPGQIGDVDIMILYKLGRDITEKGTFIVNRDDIFNEQLVECVVDVIKRG
jgi:hypothetical protein